MGTGAQTQTQGIGIFLPLSYLESSMSERGQGCYRALRWLWQVERPRHSFLLLTKRERRLLWSTWYSGLVHPCPGTCAKLQARSHYLAARSIKASWGRGKLGLGGEDVRKFVALKSDRKAGSWNSQIVEGPWKELLASSLGPELSWWDHSLDRKPINVPQREFPGHPVVRIPCFHCLGPQVQSLVRELKTPQATLHGQKKKNKKYFPRRGIPVVGGSSNLEIQNRSFY